MLNVHISQGPQEVFIRRYAQNSLKSYFVLSLQQNHQDTAYPLDPDTTILPSRLDFSVSTNLIEERSKESHPYLHNGPLLPDILWLGTCETLLFPADE